MKQRQIIAIWPLSLEISQIHYTDIVDISRVGRVPKNCTPVKVKVIVWIVTWVRVKKYRIKKNTQVVSY